MKPTLEIYSSIILPLDLVLMTGYFFFIALRLLIKQRPLVISSRWMIAFIAIAFAPSIFNSFLFRGIGKEMNMMFWINPLIFGTLMVFIIIQMKGYTAFGISEAYFRAALLSAVDSLGYSVEETMSCLKIKETNQEIQVVIQGWVGSAQLRPKSKNTAPLVKQIVHGMNGYFQNHSGKTNMMIAYFYLIIGSLLLAMAFSISRLLAHLH